MSKERRVLENEIDYLGPVAVAQFIDIGWIKHWPMGWSRSGLKAIANGYGRWTGMRQALPWPNAATERADGAAHWDGRRSRSFTS